MSLTTRVTWEQVKTRAGLRPAAGESSEDVQVQAEELLELARLALLRALTGSFRQMPPEEVDDCILIIAKTYADARRTTGNAQTTSPEDGQPRPVPRDPLAGVRQRVAQFSVGLA